MSGRVPLTLACWDYDRTSALANGDIRPDGVDLTYLSLPVEETFFRMLRYREFDAAEMSLSSYVISLLDDGPFIAIPAFTSRAFRHNGIYVNAASGIAEPGDLRGRVVGLAEYQLTANVWIRGILAEHHGVPVGSVQYRTGARGVPAVLLRPGARPPDARPGGAIRPETRESYVI
jgi:4,5-dihydroxyphthalate decarboxylase